MKENAVDDKSFAFAIRIVNLCRFLRTDKKEFVISKQMLRSGTAIGALVREAEQAESKSDFVQKMAIAKSTEIGPKSGQAWHNHYLCNIPSLTRLISDAYTHYALAKSLYFAKKLDRCEQEFGQALRLNPNFAKDLQ
jgi:hypothetical protein